MSKEYENKLISDVINAKGVTMKPSEIILKDFIKRLKTLNRDIISDILFERICEFSESEDNNDMKNLIKCLYMIEEILINKIEGYEQLLKNKIEIFENLTSHSNKKVMELSTNIVNTLNGNNKPNLTKSTLSLVKYILI